MVEIKAYCIREKKMKTMIKGKKVTMKNGRHAMKGFCKSCGAKLYKIVG